MLTSKTFRLFISSTFNDFRREREILQTKVFPHIKSYASALGYTFQPIDLRWGVSAEAQLDQKTLELCLNEVRACKSHPHPNFLIMVGDRYGWISLPYDIEQNEYETLCSLMSQKEQSQLNEWYKLDLNQLPASYILKERTEEYVDYNTWASVENILRSILQKAVNASTLTKDQKRKYFLSATEAEVEEGIIPYLNETKKQQELLAENPKLKEIDSQYIFGFLRNIDQNTQKDKGNKFIISDTDYAQAQEFKLRIQNVLPDSNILNVETKQSNSESLEEIYLIEFEEKMITFLESQIDAKKEQEDQTAYTPLQIEQEAQSYYAQQKRQDFLKTKPLEELLNTIDSYIVDRSSSSPLVIYGPSGRGKSSLMAQAIEDAKRSKVVFRFIGATPYSSSSKEILSSIFEELGIDVRSEDEKETFENFSYRIHDQIMNLTDNITIFIDAVDQLGNDDQFLWLPQTLPSNIKIIISALKDDKYKDDSRYFQTLQRKTTNLYEIPAFSDPIALLQTLLAKEDRTLQPEQEEYFLKQFTTVNSPLYITVAAEEMKHWKSTDTVGEGENDQSLSPTQKGIIQEFIHNLSEQYHHNKHFVQKVLGYLYASRDGLSESELLQLISTDEDFIKEMAPETFHDNLTKELPMVHWSRLHTQLKPFLSSKTQDNEELMYFFHREFEDAIKELISQKDEHKAIIEATQRLITKYQYEPFDSNRLGKLYATLITEYELRFYTREEQKLSIEHKSTQKRFAQFIAELENDEWIMSVSSYLGTVALDHFRHNRMHETIAHQESDFQITDVLHQTNRYLWAEYYATALSNLAASYTKVNRLDEAIKLLNKSLQILKPLYQDYPDRWSKVYTSALNNLAVSYKNVNCLDEAIKLQEKSLQIRELLYQANPDRWATEYTTALNNLAVSYTEVICLDEAIDLKERSLLILETLYQANPDRWAAEYTTALNNLAYSYKDINRLNEAIKLEEKSLQICELLYQANPDRWATEYTTALNNLAVSYKNVNRLDEAIKLQEKSLQIRELLYQANPDRWAEDYTRTISNLASSYKDINRVDEAIKLEEKSLQIRELLYQANHDRWAAEYITALSNLAGSYNKQNRVDEAIDLKERSLLILETLYQANPDRWVKYYTAALNNLASSYRDVSRVDEAIDLEEKSLLILETLYQANPDRWATEYTTALSNLAGSYNKQNRVDEAIDLEEKSLQIRELLYQASPNRWAEDYTRALNNLAMSYTEVARLDEAIELQEKSLQVLEPLYQASPNRWAEDYTRALNDFAKSYFDQNRIDEAIKLQEKCLQIFEPLYQANPDQWTKVYTTLLSNLASSYYNQNRLDEAIELQGKSLRIRELLYQASPNRWARDYAIALNGLASSYVKINEYTMASMFFKRYFQTYDFTKSLDITYFIYPFIKWYQCEEHLSNDLELAELDKLANDFKTLYWQNLGDKYELIMDDVHVSYIPLRDSEDPWDKEKYEIFVKIFLEG